MKFGNWVGLFCLIVSLIILWQFRQIVLLIFTSVVLSIALNSLVRWLQDFGKQRKINISRSRAVPISLGLVFLFSLLFLGLVLPPFLSQFQKLIALVPIAINKVLELLDLFFENPPGWLPLDRIELELPNLTEITQQFGPFAQDILGNFFDFFGNSLTVLLQILLILIFAVMFLANPLAYRKLFLTLFPSFYRRRTDEILDRCELALISWMRGICINSLFVSICCGVGLLFIGIPFVFTHALLAAVFNFMPNIGPAASVAFPLSVALLESPWQAIAVIVLYIIVQNLESYWFSPMIMQKQVSLLPAATLTAQIFFATFFGFLGLVLALPLAVVTKTWIEEAWIKDVLDRDKDTSIPTLKPTQYPQIPLESITVENTRDS
ncbi:AI-2E family transporter [Spirulina sp. 06S082]|uniref:AI-2E family transporter n=1 Tax=Spirulina sp. 06S082 TaxID=3110248 RepID=UPI002B21F9AE|nr:AI-2E family transporter [Spirulina sp. 06S082]MEA5469842.1 AI-2E family transporter [Spirulina sp. 06S082]